MHNMIEPKVTFSQVLKVPQRPVTMSSMTDDAELAEFSRRLNEICDDMQVPPKGQSRQTTLAKTFNVTQKGARKWLESEGYCSIAMGKRIAAWAHVSFDWLMTGQGKKHAAETPNHKLADEDKKFIGDISAGIAEHELPDHIKQTIMTLIGSTPKKDK